MQVGGHYPRPRFSPIGALPGLSGRAANRQRFSAKRCCHRHRGSADADAVRHLLHRVPIPPGEYNARSTCLRGRLRSAAMQRQPLALSAFNNTQICCAMVPIPNHGAILHIPTADDSIH